MARKKAKKKGTRKDKKFIIINHTYGECIEFDDPSEVAGILKEYIVDQMDYSIRELGGTYKIEYSISEIGVKK